MAARRPYQPAIIFPAGRDHTGRAKFTQYSFQQLNQLCDQYAHGLSDYGIAQGTRTLMMVKPGVDLIAVAFALIKMGAVPVLIDPGMGRHAFLQCVTETEPTAFIGIPVAHVIRHLFPQPFQNINHYITAGPRVGWGGTTLQAVQATHTSPFICAPTTLDSEAAVTFTSGSTGIPKGVVYQHGMFKAQIEIFKHYVGMEEGEIDLPGLYIFALFNPALGVTTVIPDMDARKTAQVNPAYLVEAIQTHGVTTSFGSPTIWKKVGLYCRQHKITLPSMRRIFMAGVPVMPSLITEFLDLMPNGNVFTPYGATEALPITMMQGVSPFGEATRGSKEQGVRSREQGEERHVGLALSETGGQVERLADKWPAPTLVAPPDITIDGACGVCVGQPIPPMDIQVIPISDYAIEDWDDSLPLPPGEVGEIVVKGPVVTKLYLNRPYETAKAKIKQGNDLWHRMGDLGFFDTQGRLWVCGRKSHRVEAVHGLMLTVPCEAIFNQHPTVNRCALVGLGKKGGQRPVLIVEPLAGHSPKLTNLAGQKLIRDLLELSRQYQHTLAIQDILFHPAFPVDVRHNAKIQREKLRVWAEKRI